MRNPLVQRRLTSCWVHIRVRDVSDGEAGHAGRGDGEAGELNGRFGVRGFGDGAGGRRVGCSWGRGEGQEGEVILPLVPCTWGDGDNHHVFIHIHSILLNLLYSLSSEMFPSEESSEAETLSLDWPCDLWPSAPTGKLCSLSSLVGLSWRQWRRKLWSSCYINSTSHLWRQEFFFTPPPKKIHIDLLTSQMIVWGSSGGSYFM